MDHCVHSCFIHEIATFPHLGLGQTGCMSGGQSSVLKSEVHKTGG